MWTNTWESSNSLWNQQCFSLTIPSRFIVFLLLLIAVDRCRLGPKMSWVSWRLETRHRTGAAIWKAKPWQSRKPPESLWIAFFFAKVEYYSKTHQHFVEGEVLDVEHNEACQCGHTRFTVVDWRHRMAHSTLFNYLFISSIWKLEPLSGMQSHTS